MRSLSSCAVALILGASAPLFGSAFVQTNLVSDISGLAAATDPNMKDAWGMAFSSTSPIWVNDRATGLATVYSGTGSIVSLVVATPPGAPNGATGLVFAGGTNFMVNGAAASFIFDTLGGTIDAWNSSAGTTAVVEDTTAGANFTGLAIANNTLFAANFTSGGGIDTFNSSYAPIATVGFTDSSLPAGYAPFNVQTINGNVYVTYAIVTPGSPVPVPGNGGIVDVYNTSGTLIGRLITGGQLNDPWGLAIAPASFGSFGGDLLVGNFGNGEINAFNPSTGAYIGTLDNSNGTPIVNSGLWAINFGNSSANPNGLYFDAGLNQGADGLFGVITLAPEPGSIGLSALGLVGLAGLAFLRSRR